MTGKADNFGAGPEIKGKRQKAEKGLFFTTDAVLALAVVALIIGAAFSLLATQQSSGAGKSMMDMAASDSAVKNYLKGDTTHNDNVPLTGEKKQASCAEFFKYDSDAINPSPITVAVRKCKWPA